MRRKSDNPDKWSMTDLGRRIGVSHVAVLRWEQGTRIPELHHLRALCRVLNLEPWDLMPPPPEGPHLVHLRVRTYLTQLQVADRLRIAPPTYSAIENGERPLNPSTTRDLARAFKTSLKDIEIAHSRTVLEKSDLAIDLREPATEVAVFS